MGETSSIREGDDDLGLSARSLRAILERRAAALAAPYVDRSESAEGIEIVAFARGRAFAVEIERLVEIRPLAPWARLPASPSACFGVLQVRGTAVAILDLAARFEIAAASPGDCAYAVVVESAGIPVALAADDVGDVRLLERERIRPASPVEARGIGSVARGFADEVAVLDVHRLVRSELARTGDPRFEE